VLEHLPPLSGNSPWDFVYTARVVTVEDAKEYARAVLASAPVACDHQFHFFVDQTERRCNRCGVIESRQAPLYRRKFCSGIDRAPMAATKVRSTTTASKTRANCPARGCRSSPGASRTRTAMYGMLHARHGWREARALWKWRERTDCYRRAPQLTPLPLLAMGGMMRKKLTPNQRRVLENLAAGRRADSHCVGRSQFGGLTGTLASLRRAELIDLNGLTDAGREAISPQQTAKEKHDRPQTPCQRRPSAVAWSWSVGLR
jgi:hypothetical protein